MTSDTAAELADHIRGAQFGDTLVRDASATIERDSEEDLAVFLDLTLSDPSESTWPREDITNLRRRIFELVRTTDVELTVYVRLSPSTDEPQEDDSATAL